MCDAFYDIEDFKNDLREACAKLKSLQGICENALGGFRGTPLQSLGRR